MRSLRSSLDKSLIKVKKWKMMQYWTFVTLPKLYRPFALWVFLRHLLELWFSPVVLLLQDPWCHTNVKVDKKRIVNAFLAFYYIHVDSILIGAAEKNTFISKLQRYQSISSQFSILATAKYTISFIAGITNRVKTVSLAALSLYLPNYKISNMAS